MKKTISLTLSFTLLAPSLALAEPPAAPPPITRPAAKPTSSDATRAVQPKALSPTVEKGLAWLVAHQLEDGGWGQGEESRHMGGTMSGQVSKGNVADTCVATLALLRAGSTPKDGPHKAAIGRALDYVLREIEAADDDALYVTSNRGTRVQGKLGPYVDTFLSAQLLAEVKDQMPDEASSGRLSEALDKVLAKIRKHQKSDGTWGGGGWAPVLSQAMAGKALNTAARKGVKVDEETRRRVEKQAGDAFDGKGNFAGEGSAGVGLYAAAASVGTLRASDDTNAARESAVKEALASAKKPEEKARAQAELDRIRDTRQQSRAAEQALTKRLEDPAFVSGFGSNGGEEFLSYMLVSESLVAKGGEEWRKWDATMTQNLGRVQNGDGSWTGHHCITGRTFVTSAALLVLTADRARSSIADKIRRG